MDVDALLAPLDGATSAGEDLSYSSERSAIEAPFQLDTGETVVEERAWRDAIKSIQAQAKQTRDLWLAVYLARGGAKVGDLDLVVGGTELLAGLLERFWDDVHPTLDEADFIGRKTPCESLTKIREFLAPLRRTTLFAHRLGNFTGEDLERIAAEGEAAPNYGQFRAAIGSVPPEELKEQFATALAKLDGIKVAIERADKVLTDNAGSDTGTNFQPTYDALAALRRAIQPYAGATTEAEAAGAEIDPDGGAIAASGSSPGPRIGGRVESREDVIKALDAIGDYYRAREPGSPVPVLLKRARHWVSLEFMDVLEDLVPDSLAEARKVLVAKADMPEGYSGY